MKFLNKTFIILLLIIISLHSQNGNTEMLTIPITYPNKPGILNIEHYKGSIQITGYEGNTIIVRATLKHPGEKSNHRGLKKLTANAIKLNAFEKNNTVTLNTNSINKTIDLQIDVPQYFSLKIKNNDTGNITIHNLSGEMEISAITGYIQLTAISGSAVINSVDGNITAGFNKIEPGTPMAFTTLEGNIDLTFPQQTNARFKVKTENGDIFTNLKQENNNRETYTEHDPATGINKIYLDAYTYCQMNNGGPEILCKSFNGNIYIRQSEK